MDNMKLNLSLDKYSKMVFSISISSTYIRSICVGTRVRILNEIKRGHFIFDIRFIVADYVPTYFIAVFNIGRGFRNTR